MMRSRIAAQSCKVAAQSWGRWVTHVGWDERDYAPGRWYGSIAQRDYPDVAPSLGYTLLVVGEITSPLTVLEGTGTSGEENYVLTHTFTLRVPHPYSEGEVVELCIVEPTCTYHEDLPRWLDAVRPARRLAGRLCNLALHKALDEQGRLRASTMELLHDVRIVVPEGEE